MVREGKISRALDSFLCLFYVLFIVLWFKDNIPPLKNIDISPWVPFVGILVVLLVKIFLRIKQRKVKFFFRPSRTLLYVIIIVVIVVGFRIPYLIHHFGLDTSDDAVPALMSKHIAEGKLPPIYYYGQLYMGSVSEHFIAILIFLFGYSPFLLKVAALFIYSAFVVVQFLLLREIFSLNFALAACLFYGLPIGYLVDLSFEIRWAYSFVFLLGSSMIYMGYLIHYKNKENLVPWLGFLMGLSFWAHQISVCFILISLFFVVLRIKTQVKKYLALIFLFSVGALPVLMAEIYHGFPLFQFLSPGEPGNLSWTTVTNTSERILKLLSIENHILGYVFLFFILSGFGTLLYSSFKKKKLMPQSIFALFFLLFCFMYVFSSFSRQDFIRYLHPLYVCLPVLLISVFLFIKSRVRYFFMGGLIIFLFLSFNLRDKLSFYQKTEDLHHHLSRVIASMKETGEKYWRGEYWTAYLITALTGEEVIVDSYSRNRYFPYALLYENDGQNNNFVFLKSDPPGKFQEVLKVLKIGCRTERIGDSSIIFGVETHVPRHVFRLPVPSQIPEIEITRTNAVKGLLEISYKSREEIRRPGGYKIHFEVQGFSSKFKSVPLEGEVATIRIPFPKQETFSLISYLDYRGLKIPSTLRKTPVVLSEQEIQARTPKVIYLSGFGPVIDIEGEKVRVCEKEARLEINRRLKEKSRIRLHLISPMEFSHPYWYGDYAQQVRVHVNQIFHSIWKLKDGKNIIDLEIENDSGKDTSNLISLEFKYHLSFSFAPGWKTAALLGKIDIE